MFLLPTLILTEQKGSEMFNCSICINPKKEQQPMHWHGNCQWLYMNQLLYESTLRISVLFLLWHLQKKKEHYQWIYWLDSDISRSEIIQSVVKYNFLSFDSVQSKQRWSAESENDVHK